MIFVFKKEMNTTITSSGTACILPLVSTYSTNNDINGNDDDDNIELNGCPHAGEHVVIPPPLCAFLCQSNCWAKTHLSWLFGYSSSSSTSSSRWRGQNKICCWPRPVSHSDTKTSVSQQTTHNVMLLENCSNCRRQESKCIQVTQLVDSTAGDSIRQMSSKTPTGPIQQFCFFFLILFFLSSSRFRTNYGANKITSVLAVCCVTAKIFAYISHAVHKSEFIVGPPRWKVSFYYYCYCCCC